MATYKTSYASLYPTTSTSSHTHTHRHTHQKVSITPAPQYQTSTPAPNISTPFVNFTQTPTPTPIYTQTPAPNVLSGVQKDISTTQFWIYKEAWNYFAFVSKVLGKPDEINTCASGFITWYKSPADKLFGMRNIFSKHVLRDQSIAVECPTPRVDFFYSYVKYRLNYLKINDILSISTGISYDPVAGELCVRGSNLGQNIIILLLAIQVNIGALNIRNIYADGTISKFFKDSEKPTAIIHHYRTLTNIIPEIKDPITNENIQNKRRYDHNPFPLMFKE
tara:strand:+ start:283 stop:1116 length:834 start_codon:yes stop_codon:yes gene_type:complete